MSKKRPSHTAVKIGRGMLILGQDPQLASLLPDGVVAYSERLMMRVGLLKPWERSLMQKPWLKKLSDFMERHFMAGASLHFAARKRFIDDETRAAIQDGAKQVLVVGAGFDTLSARLSAQFPEVNFIEVDQPATSEVKKRGIEALGDLRPNFKLLGVDLNTTGLEEVLSSGETWQRDAASVVIAEGVLMYLTESAVSTFLTSVHALMDVGSRLLFTYMRLDEKGRICGGAVASITRLSLKMIGEPWLWGVPEGGLEDFLSGRGFHQIAPERCDLKTRYLEPAGLADRPLGDIERVAIAEKNR